MKPDEFHVLKPIILMGMRGIIHNKFGAKVHTLGYAYFGVGVENRPTPLSKQKLWVLTVEEVETLATRCVLTQITVMAPYTEG